MSRTTKVLLLLASVPVLCLLAVGTVIAAPTFGTGLTFEVVHVRVEEKRPGGIHLSLPVPAALVDAGLRLALSHSAGDPGLELSTEARRALPVLRELTAALADTADATLVEVRSGREEVRVAKRGDQLKVTVRSVDADVDLSVPVALLPRVFQLLAETSP
jgi:hypothetical protein